MEVCQKIQTSIYCFILDVRRRGDAEYGLAVAKAVLKLFWEEKGLGDRLRYFEHNEEEVTYSGNYLDV